jgi:hypothetical protein
MTRIPCIVPFCRRTISPSGPHTGATEWICANHWRLVPRTWKRRLSLFKRHQRWDLCDNMWERMKAKAIEAAGGIG